MQRQADKHSNQKLGSVWPLGWHFTLQSPHGILNFRMSNRSLYVYVNNKCKQQHQQRLRKEDVQMSFV